MMMMMMGTSSSASSSLALLMLVALLLQPALGAIYEFDLDLEDSTTYIYSEGPMFVKGDTPMGNEDSKISLDLSVKTAGGEDPVDGVNINIIFFDALTSDAVGYGVDQDDGSIVTRSDLCCTEDIVTAGLCTNVGEVWYPGGESATNPTPTKTFNFKLKQAEGTFQTDQTVTQIGEQYVAVVACGVSQKINIAGTITFKNPYGYLSGESFGFLPMYGSVMAAYLVLLLLFIYSSVRNCDRLLHIQHCITGILCLSFVTSAVWFGMYLDLDTTGKAVCCPLHVGATIAVFLDACKRSFSRCLLLAVCLGYGVVTPKLKRRQTAEILLLGTLYVVFAFYHDIRIDNDGIPADLDLWALPVTFLEVCFVTWTYHGLTQVQADLNITGQSAKLKMYQTLTRTLVAFVIIFLVHSLVTILCRGGQISLPWNWNWLLSFTSSLFSLILTSVICYVWAPSSTAQQYAYSFQLPSSAEEADAYEMETGLGEIDDEEESDAGDV
eukprot:INCI16957.1.p1 GENE.INCI16957.1~~INCI16957.1.p1  ORF type:complete len:495 (+),score=78.21 INCI16957.1:197-1681(+)